MTSPETKVSPSCSSKISNMCITLNEFPYIRYYVPMNHPPLGPLKPHTQTRPPPPAESSQRWRTNLARGAEARAYESVEGHHATRLLALMVQNNLEEYKKANADFAVCLFDLSNAATIERPYRNIRLMIHAHVEHCSSRTDLWIC